MSMSNIHWAGVIAGVLLFFLLLKVITDITKGNEGRFLVRDLNKYLLWDRRVKGSLLGATYAASMVSAMVFVPLPGLFYTHGIGAWLFICLPVIFGVTSFLWFGVRLHRLQDSSPRQLLSPFELIGSAYESRFVGAALFLVTALFVVPLIAMQIVSFGRLAEGFLDVPYWVSVILIVTLFVFYTAFAGMQGDVKTDKFQGWAMVVGLLLVAGLVLHILLTDRPQTGSIDLAPYFSLPGPNGFFTVPVLISVGILMAALPLVNGHYIMRFMIARNEDALRKGMTHAAMWITAFYVLAGAIGLMGVVAVPGLDSGDMLTGAILERSGFGVFGIVAGGVILFGIVAASLSSVDSQFLALGAGACRDIFLNVFNYSLPDKEQLILVRLIMFVMGVAAIGMALDPPRLVIQLNVLAAAGPLILLPTAVVGVIWPRRVSGFVPLGSIFMGLAAFFILYSVFGNDGIQGWNIGLISGMLATLVFAGLVGVDMARTERPANDWRV